MIGVPLLDGELVHGDVAVSTGVQLQSHEQIGVETVARDESSSISMSSRQELVGRVAAGLAHDLNGPIGVMLGFTQLAREKLEADDSATSSVVEYLKMIESAGENARSLARDMWDFANSSAGKVGEFDLTELLETTGRLVAPTLRVASIEPPADGELASRMMTGDRARWAEALVGLMIEAPTALPGGGSLTWGLKQGVGGKTVTIVFVASPNDAETSVITPVPAQDWEFQDESVAIINGLGGTIGPLSGLDDDKRGIEVSVPTDSSRS